MHQNKDYKVFNLQLIYVTIKSPRSKLISFHTVVKHKSCHLKFVGQNRPRRPKKIWEELVRNDHVKF